jgi:hypothetical protein
VHLVDEGQRVVLVGHVTDLLDRRNVAVHRVHLSEEGENKKTE